MFINIEGTTTRVKYTLQMNYTRSLSLSLIMIDSILTVSKIQRCISPRLPFSSSTIIYSYKYHCNKNKFFLPWSVWLSRLACARRFQVPSLVGACAGGNRSMFLPPSLGPALPPLYNQLKK